MSRIPILLVSIILTACSPDQKPGYLSQLPDLNRFDYLPIPEETLSDRRITVVPELWISGSDNSEHIIASPFWIEKLADEIWIADPIRRNVTAHSIDGTYLRMVAERGGGPGEVQQPAGIHYQKNNGEDQAWVLDPGSQSIIQYSATDGELFRVHQKQMLIEFYNNRVASLSDSTLIFPLMNHEEHVLGVVNFRGDLIDTRIKRIIPAGYQPITHNRVFFDTDKETGRIVYAYHGMPLVFLEDLNSTVRKVVNFKPATELEEINTSLDLRPIDERVTVQSVIRDLFLVNNRIYFRLFNDIVVFNTDSEQVEKVITLANSEGEPLIFQQMFLSGGTFYLVNRFEFEVYKFSKSSL